MNGKVINFYSFKGGVGRTVTLRKVSEILRSRGFSIAVVDMDLECPGYSIIESVHNNDIKEHQAEGFSLSLLEIAKQYLKILIKDKQFDVAHKYVHETIEPYLDSNFLVVPAYSSCLQKFSEGDFDNYVDHLKYLEFNEFSKVVGNFLEALIEPLKRKFDYVLIDNRTGLAETSIWNIRKFSDLTVWVLTLSIQNIEGIRLTYSRYSQPLDDSSSNDSNRFIFVANITPPLPELSKKHADQLAKILNIPVSKIINIPYAPKPILNELFSDNSALDKRYKSISAAILEENENTPFFNKRYSQVGCSFFSLSEIEYQFSQYDDVSLTIFESTNYTNLLKEIERVDDYGIRLELINMLFTCLFKNKAFNLLLENFKKYINENIQVRNNSWVSIITKAYQASIIIDDQISMQISNLLDGFFLDDEMNKFNVYPNDLNFTDENYLMYLNCRLFHLFKEISKLYDDNFIDNNQKFLINILSLFKVWFLLSSNNVAITSYLWPPKKPSCIFPLLSTTFTSFSPERNTIIYNALCCMDKDVNKNLVPQRILSLLLKIQVLLSE